MRDLTRAMTPKPGPQFQMLACQITQVTPLRVQLATGGITAGVRVAGATYSVGGQAVALWNPPNAPVILPIGT